MIIKKYYFLSKEKYCKYVIWRSIEINILYLKYNDKLLKLNI
ncbi:hypothetical protein HMPREF1983_00289 [Gemella bergeri ATCC 700627]|uniref:Uncharacterized protein n=1 Tax=Gemella bergeri ATCC 700627 TaxID=1321820 RepID=U2S394_9BACL|nr:hypothetical protein HMPREF1983_00289 [Gemella bergeri ATCC 700627]